MRPQGFLLLAITVPNLALAGLLLLRNARDKVNLFFAMLVTSGGLWPLGLAGFIFSHDPKIAMYWAQEYYIAAALIAYTFVLFCLVYTGKIRLKLYKHILLAAPAFGLCLAILFFRQFLLIDIEYHDWGKEVTLNTAGYLLYGAYFTSYVVYGFKVILEALFKSTGLKRLHLKFISAGLTVSFALGAIFNLFYPFFGNYQFIWVGPLFMLVYIASVSYAIIKHRMFDIRLVLARSFAYLGTLLVMSTLFGFVVFSLVSIVFEQKFPWELQVTLSLSTALLAIGYNSIKKFFDKISNKFFYRDSYDAQEFLDYLNRVLVSSTDIDTLLNKSSQIIESNLKSQFCYFGLRETSYISERTIGDITDNLPEKDNILLKSHVQKFHTRVIVADEIEDFDPELYEVMRRHNIAVIGRLVTTVQHETEGLGYLALGYKRSGNPYNKQDVNIIRIVANELVIAIENALRFEEIENFNVTLQEKVDDATKRLKRANDKLKAMDETKDEFISMASHQLRTPLTSVKGYVSMVLEGDAGPLNETQHKLLEQSFASSQRMVYLIADLLNLSRLRTGKFVIENKPTNLADVIESEIEQLKASAASRNLTLTYDKPKDFPELMLDETKIRQVVMNFSDNAIYYTPSGGKIDIKLKETKDSVEFTVNDNGIGIPVAEQHHLFNKFYRAKNAQKARPDGTGLGLFMAKKVIIAQGGAVIFHSVENKGSTFGFTFSKQKLKVPDIKPAPEAKEVATTKA